MSWATFWAIFSQTHLVTLLATVDGSNLNAVALIVSKSADRILQTFIYLPALLCLSIGSLV
jgi:hypothetical protein